MEDGNKPSRINGREVNGHIHNFMINLRGTEPRLNSHPLDLQSDKYLHSGMLPTAIHSPGRIGIYHTYTVFVNKLSLYVLIRDLKIGQVHFIAL